MTTNGPQGTCEGCGAVADGILADAVLACERCSARVLEELNGQWAPVNYVRSVLRPDPPGTGSAALSPTRRAARDIAMMLQRQFAEAAAALDDPALPNDGWEKTIANVYRLWAATLRTTPDTLAEQFTIHMVRIAATDSRDVGRSADEALEVLAFLFPERRLSRELFVAAVKAWREQSKRSSRETWTTTTALVDFDAVRDSTESVRNTHKRWKSGPLGQALEELIRHRSS